MNEKITISGEVASATERGMITLWVRKTLKHSGKEIFKKYVAWFEMPTGAKKGDWVELESFDWYEKETEYTDSNGLSKKGRETHVNEPRLLTLREAVVNVIVTGAAEVKDGQGNDIDINAPF